MLKLQADVARIVTAHKEFIADVLDETLTAVEQEVHAELRTDDE